MVDEYESLIIPLPEQFRGKYRLIPKPMTDRPLQIRDNQNVRRPPKSQRSPPPPPKKELEGPIILPYLQFRNDKPLQEPDSITDKPSPKIKELNRALNPIKPGLFSSSPGPGGLRGPDAKNQG